MDTLQKLFEATVLKQGKKVLIERAIQLIERKAKRAGAALTKFQKTRLRKLLRSEQFSSTTLRFRGKSASASRRITFTKKDAKEVERYYNSYLRDLHGVAEKVAEPQARLLLSALKKNWPSQRAHHLRDIEGFERRLMATWKALLDLLQMHILIALDASAKFNEHYRKTRILKRPLLIEVLTRLHARSCQVASEILTLLKSGFSDGAMARWRTLHEITVTAFFIQKHGEGMAKRYLRYDAIESYKGARQHQEYCKRLGYAPFSSTEMQIIENARSQAIDEFGEPFGKNYGWAAVAFKKPEHTFTQIEKDIGMNHLRPYYKWASQNVHADPKGILDRLGLVGKEMILAGPSNIGLSDPGHSTAISLLQVTSCLLLFDPILDRIVMAKAMMMLTDEIGVAFLKAHKSIEAREKKIKMTQDGARK